MKKYKHIRPADVYVSIEQYRVIAEDRKNGIPHPEITTIRLTGNNFFDLFATLVEDGGGMNTEVLAKWMGVRPRLLSPAIEAMSGLTAHEWAVRYKHISACDKLGIRGYSISSIASRLGFSLSAFSHFFYRIEHCYPTAFAEKGSCRLL
jgi:AraC-like DNA-binding protein